MLRYVPECYEYELLCDRCGFVIASATDPGILRIVEQLYFVAGETRCPLCNPRPGSVRNPRMSDQHSQGEP
jgi:hypothetical protein